MPFDPAAGFPLDPEAALRERVRDLERRLAANPGAQAGGGFIAATSSIDGRLYQPAELIAAGPSVELTVPEPGAFVEVYAEADIRLINAQTGQAAGSYFGARIWVTRVGAVDADGSFGNQAVFTVVLPFGFPTGFTRVRQPGRAVGSDGGSALRSVGIWPEGGAPNISWATPGRHTFYLNRGLIGTGVGTGSDGLAEIKNARLMARVRQ